MTILTETQEKISVLNTNNSLDEVAYSIHNDTVQSNTESNEVTLSSGASATDIYSNYVIEIVSGDGAEQSRLISSYNGTTKVCTLAENWGIIPSTNDYYTIHINSGICQPQTHNGYRKSIVLSSSTASTSNDFYNDCFIKLLYGTGVGQIRRIIDYDGPNKKAKVERPWHIFPDETTLYAIYGESGTAVSGTSTTIVLQDSHGHSTTDDYYNQYYIEIYKGTGQGQVSKIIDYTGTSRTVTVTSWSIAIPDSTSVYKIYGGWAGNFEDISPYAMTSTIIDLDELIGERIISDVEMSVTSTGSAKIHKYHEMSSSIADPIQTITNISQYYRQRLIGLGTTVTGAIQTLYHKSKSSSDQTYVNESITTERSCQLNRSVLVGQSNSGIYNNITSTEGGALNVALNGPYDAFGNIRTAIPKSILSLTFLYDIDDTSLVHTFTQGSGTVTQSDSFAVISTSTTNSSIANLYSQKRSIYTPGMGMTCRFAAIFDQSRANTIQLAGLGDACNGLFFGYNGIEMSILRRTGGKQEIRTLTISNGASTTGNTTLTLDSQTIDISVASGDTTWQVARKIADTDFTNVGSGWEAYEDDGMVIFIAIPANSISGTFDVSGQSVAGSFAQIQSGVAPTDEYKGISNWNIDRVNGFYGLPVIDFTKGNVFEIDIQWHGFGEISFSIENPRSGILTPVHKIKYAGSATIPSMENPNLPLYLYVKNEASGAADVTLKSTSLGVFVYGNFNPFTGPRFGISTLLSNNLTASNVYNVITIRSNAVYKNKKNVSEVFVISASFSYNDQNPAMFRFIRNATINNTSALTWTSRNDNSIISYCTNFYTVTGGIEISSFQVGSLGSVYIDLDHSDLYIYPNDTISVVIVPLLTANNAEYGASINWVEKK